MKKTDKRSILFTVASILLVILLASCSDAITEHNRDAQASSLAQVYSDGVISLSAASPVKLDGSDSEHEFVYIPVSITNGDTSPIAFSNVLCVDVRTADGKTCSQENITIGYSRAQQMIDDFSPLDGYIKSGSEKQGYIFFEAPKGSGAFHISLATDFAAGEWIEFDITA